ncbi:MAG: response regulator [Pseudomonadota bacterium]
MITYDLSNLRVLIVDDNDYMRRIIAMFLRSMGVRKIIEKETAGQALSEVRRFVPDLLITDWMMRPVDGLDLVRQVRMDRDPSISHLPIIVLTGFTDLPRVYQARDAGVHEVLAKPISATILYQRIISLIEHPKPFLRTTDYFGPDRHGGQTIVAEKPTSPEVDEAVEDVIEI